jgi:uncharacterized repeat protein (TIGR03899 family)
MADRAKAIQGITVDTPQQISDLKIIGGEIASAQLTAMPSLPDRTTQRTAYQSALQQVNLEAVLLNAAAELTEEEQVATEPVSEGWTTRFVKIVEDIPAEELQVLWGKILAGEIKAPGSFSLRTLEVLRNLTQHEASIFSNLASLVVELHSVATDAKSRFIYKSDYLSNHVPYRDIMLMFDCGLLQPLESSTYDVTLSSEKQLFAFRVGSQVLQIQGECAAAFFQLENYTLTTAGVELARLTAAATPLAYLQELAVVFKEIGLSASYADFVGWTGKSEGRILIADPLIEL